MLANPLKDLSFQTLFDAAADAMLLVNDTGHVVEANPAALELLEYTKEALLGLSVEALMPTNFRDSYRQYRNTFYKNPEKRPMGNGRDLFALSSSGKELAVDIGLSPIKTPDKTSGETHGQLYILITFYAADKRREADRALRINEERLRLAKQAANLGIFDLDPKQFVLHCDEKMLEFWGRKPDQAISYDEFLAAINPEDRVSRQVGLDCSFDPAGNGEYNIEYRITNPNDGIERWLAVVGKARFKNGQADRMVGVVKDITESKKIAELLKKAHEQLSAFIHQAPLCVAMFDLNMNYLAYSKRWLMLYGRGYEDLTGLNHYEVNPDMPKQWKLIHKDVLAGVAFENIDDAWIQSDGSTHWLRWSALPWVDENTEIGGIIITAEDKTTEKMLEKKLQEHREETEDVFQQQVAIRTASAIAHELNQPLAAISAYGEVALHTLDHPITSSPEKLRRALEGCVAQAQRAGTSLHELLAFLQEGELVTEQFDLNDIVLEAISIAKSDSNKEFQLKLHLDKHIPAVLGNRIHVQKVLVNLLRNAVEAMRGAKVAASEISVMVRTHKEMNMAHVTVKDNGPGISQEKFKKIFEPFFTTKPTGIGMGLAISRALIETNGGQLWLEPNNTSGNTKTGATFHFTLPFAP